MTAAVGAIAIADWDARKAAAFEQQIQALSAPRELRLSQRPRDPDHWLLLEATVRALMHARESSGEWTWVTPRHVVIRAPGGAQ